MYYYRGPFGLAKTTEPMLDPSAVEWREISEDTYNQLVEWEAESRSERYD